MQSRVAVFCGLALTAVTVAEGAPDAGAKARGAYNFYGNSVHSSLQSAQSHAQHYSSYLSRVQSSDTVAVVDPEIARVAGDTIGTYIVTMRRHVAAMRRHATALGDTEGLGMLDDVERNLAEAQKHHDALHAVHSGERIDPAAAQRHVDQVNAALRKAKAEHDEVMQKIGDGS